MLPLKKYFVKLWLNFKLVTLCDVEKYTISDEYCFS